MNFGASRSAWCLGVLVVSDANRLADKVANSLQQFFAKQGWTAPPSVLPTL
jgi:hypothetical protein